MKVVSASGVTKSTRKARRATLGGVVGDKVIIPGSPAMTWPELLQKAEVELENDTGVLGLEEIPSRLDERDPFRTLLPAVNAEPSSTSTLSQEMPDREWTCDEWKQLDACFTDGET
jgi:hypothetical protein